MRFDSMKQVKLNNKKRTQTLVNQIWPDLNYRLNLYKLYGSNCLEHTSSLILDLANNTCFLIDDFEEEDSIPYRSQLDKYLTIKLHLYNINDNQQFMDCQYKTNLSLICAEGDYFKVDLTKFKYIPKINRWFSDSFIAEVDKALFNRLKNYYQNYPDLFNLLYQEVINTHNQQELENLLLFKIPKKICAEIDFQTDFKVRKFLSRINWLENNLYKPDIIKRLHSQILALYKQQEI